MKKLPASYLEPKIFNNQFIVKHQISSGSFGVVYFAIDKHTKEEVAIKCEKESKHDSGTLDREIYLLKKLAGVVGVPKVYWHGCEQNYNVIVMELLGKDLGHYINKYKRLSLKSGLQMAEQLIDIMQQVHKRGVMHRDLKPENILFGRTENENKVFLADYGVSKQFIEHGKHIPFRDKKSFIGTTRYASCAAHRGDEIGRKDDLESLFYVIIYSILGKLPWQNLQNIGDKDRTIAVGEVKISTEISVICKDLPKQFATILNYLRELNFSSEPDYELIKKQIELAAKDKYITFDGTFEWTDIQKLKQTSNNNESLKMKQENKNNQASPNPIKIKDLLVSEQPKGNSYLQVPDFQLGGQASPQNTSHSGQGSFSSMQIKYIPTVMQDQQSENQKMIMKNDSYLENNGKNVEGIQKIAISQPHIDLKALAIQFHNCDSITGFREDIEENIEDQMSLDQKYQQLIQQQVQASFKEQKDNNGKVIIQSEKKNNIKNNGKKKLNI